LLCPAGLHPTGLSGLLAEVRRPGRIAESLALVARRQLQQQGERAWMIVDRGGWVAALT
jgi:uncharacterized lipoprotein